MLLHRDDIVRAWSEAVDGSSRESEDNGLAVLLESVFAPNLTMYCATADMLSDCSRLFL